MTIKPHLVPIGPASILRSVFSVLSQGNEDGKGEKGKPGGVALSQLCSLSLSHLLLLFIVPLSQHGACARGSGCFPRLPSISLFHIYAQTGIPRGKFSSVVQNGLHYHNLSEGTTLARGLGGFNVIINQNPR